MDSDRRCEECGRQLPANAPLGLCPRCLVAMGMSIAPDVSPRPVALHSDGLLTEPGSGIGRIRYFGDYELLKEIARGGMGVVYRARQISLNRIVAVKMLLVGALADEIAVKRFRIEAEAVASLQHPNIVTIHEIGRHEGQHYYSMDCVEGQTLAERAAGNPLPPALAADYLRTIARAMSYAHERGVLHRDLKPSNVLIDALDRPRITDFGLAKRLGGNSDLTEAGQVLGTLNYMAPEQARGIPAEVGTDIYSMGAILYYLLTGRPPFTANTFEAVVQQVLNAEPSSPRALAPGVPRDLETICLKCLQKEPRQRYESASELAADLDRWLNRRPIQARPVTHMERAMKWMSRRPGVAAMAAALFLLLLLAAVGSIFAAFGIDRARRNEIAALEKTRLAEAQLQKKLWESHLAHARANRLSAQPGRYFRTMETIALAAKIRPSLELRNEAIACLALEDVRLRPGVMRDRPDVNGVVLDSAFESFALITPEGDIVIGRLLDGEVHETVPCRDRVARWLHGFSSSGRYLAFHSDRAHQCVWDRKAARMALEGLSIPEGGLVLNPTEDSLATANPDGSISVYDLGSRQATCLTPHASRGIRAMAFNWKGERLACFNPTTSQGVVLDLKANQSYGPFVVPGFCEAMAWSPDGSLLAAACRNGCVYIFDSVSGALLKTCVGHDDLVERLAFNSAGTLLASTGWDVTIRLWDPCTGEQVMEFAGSSHQLQFSRDGQLLGPVLHDGIIRLLEVAAHPEYQRLRSRSGRAAAFSPCVGPDGRWVAALLQRRAHFWDVSTGLEIGVLPELNCDSIAIVPDGSALITRSEFGFAKWAIHPGTNLLQLGPRRSLRHLDSESLGDKFLGFDRQSPEENQPARVEVSTGGQRGLDSMAELGPHPAPGVTQSTDGKWLAGTFQQNAGVTIHDAPSGRLVKALTEPPQTDVLFSPDSRWLATAGSEYHLWKTGDWLPGPVVSLPQKNPIQGVVAFSADSSLFAIAVGGRTVRLLETARGRTLADFEAPTLSLVRGLCFGPAADCLVATDSAGQVHLWRLPLIRKRLVAMSLDWEMPPGHLPEAPGPVAPLRLEVLGSGTELQTLVLSRERADRFGRRGFWNEAIAEARQALEIEPGDHALNCTLGPALVARGDRAGYSALCRQIMAQWIGTGLPAAALFAEPAPAASLAGSTLPVPVMAEQMARNLLILPSAGVDSSAVGALAEIAVTAATGGPYCHRCECTKALAEYRSENFQGALDWACKSISGFGPGDCFPHAEAYMVMAMAHCRLNHFEQAKVAFTMGLEVAGGNLSEFESVDLGEEWRDWVVANALVQEARVLLNHGPHGGRQK